MLEIYTEDDYQLGQWYFSFSQSAESPVIKDLDGNLIATVHGEKLEALDRALRIARCPALIDAAIGALIVFRLIAEHGDENSSASANDIIPVLEAALWEIEDQGSPEGSS